MSNLIVTKSLEVIATTEKSQALKFVDGVWLPTSQEKARTYSPPGIDHSYTLQMAKVGGDGRTYYWWECGRCTFRFGTADKRISWKHATTYTCDEFIARKVLND